MEVIDSRDHNVPIVNGLLQKAFGPRFAGNFGDNDSVPLPEIPRLGFIVNKRFLGYHKVIGRFDSDDGSSIRILPEYASNAIVYSEMYETRFRKKAIVTLDPLANGGREIFIVSYF